MRIETLKVSTRKGGPSLNAGKALSSGPGFTLIELLVVIATIGILAALLCPALSRASGKSKSIACKSNLRQLGLVLGMYLQDSAGTYPYLISFPAPNRRGTSFWFDALALSLPNMKWGEGVLRCPAYKGVVYEGESKANDRGEIMSVYCPCGSYAYNAAGRRQLVSGPAGLISPGLGFSLFAGQPQEQPVRELEVKAPADLFAFGDAPLCTAPWATAATLILGGAADYNSLIAENAVIEKGSHAHVFNMLFADTHAESVKTEVLLSTTPVCRSRWNHDHQP